MKYTSEAIRIGKMAIFPTPMMAVAAFSATEIVDVTLPTPTTTGPITGVAFSNVVPIPVTAAAFAETTFPDVPITAGTIYEMRKFVLIFGDIQPNEERYSRHIMVNDKQRRQFE